jgi:cyclase
MGKIRLAALACLFMVTFAGTPALAQDFSKVEIQTKDLGNGISMLAGAGGNLAASVGSDGVFLVDDDYAPLTDKIRAAVAKLSDRPIRFVVNTHWHGDHTGGNENFAKAGVVLIAHDNVRARMSTEQFLKVFGEKVPPSPALALPVVTFADAVTLHLNGQEILVRHVPPAHTDGDSLVFFKGANVLHLGDLFFNGLYPFIDLDSGGSVEGLIGALGQALDMADDSTKIIPGHGPLTDKATLKTYRDFLVTVRDRVKALIALGKTKEEVLAAKPSAEWDEAWGKAFINPPTLITAFYDSLKAGG